MERRYYISPSQMRLIHLLASDAVCRYLTPVHETNQSDGEPCSNRVLPLQASGEYRDSVVVDFSQYKDCRRT